MTEERVRRRPRRAAAGVGQAPWRTLRNPYRPIEILSADEIEMIHRASLRILGEIGVEVLGDRAIDLFRADGADIDDATRRVRLDPDRVEELVALAPPEFELHARNPERNVRLGGDHLVFCAVGGPAFVTDLDRGRRAGNHADFVDYVRLIGSLDVIHQEGGGPLEPTDLPVATRHLDMYHALATNLDKTWHCLGFGATVVDDALEMVAIARGVDRDHPGRRAEPDHDHQHELTAAARRPDVRGPHRDGDVGPAGGRDPFTLAGAMTPATLAGAIAQQNAEALFCIALSQLVRPGTPMVYGAFTSNVDMRTGSPAFGTPEYVKERSRAARWRAATGCRGARRMRRPRTSSTPRPRTNPRWRCGAP